jgi:hypothetical protein
MIGAAAVNRYVRDDPDPRVLPELLLKIQALENYAASQSILFGYPDYSGWRSQADTTQLITWRDQAVSKFGPGAYYPVSPFGVGFHGKGAAEDVKVVQWPSSKSSAWAYQTLGLYAPRIGLRWGGLFPAPNVDPYHFELAIALSAAQTRFDQWQSQQRAMTLTGLPGVVLTPSAPSDISLLSFPTFALPSSPVALPKTFAEIKKIVLPTSAVPIVVVGLLGIAVAGFLNSRRG